MSGVEDDLAERLFECALDDVDADLDVPLGLDRVDGFDRAEQRNAAARNDAFFDGALVACMASSTRAFFSFISVSVAAPTLITATPPTSFARRSWSFSRS